MPIRSVKRSIVDNDGASVPVFVQYVNWSRSPRVNGKLVLVANALQWVTDDTRSRFWNGPGKALAKPPSSNNEDRIPPGFSWTPIDNRAYSKFQGKLRKGSASLGVTLGSWKQSRDMIVQRHQHLARTLDSTYEALRGNSGAVKRLRREREPLANQILETEFGWRPLIEDVRAALTTVCDGVPPQFIGSRAKSVINDRIVQTAGKLTQINTWEGNATVSYSAKVTLTNPNLWLLNRMGLINPATVVWDLIPWSFVVNMFVNVNAMISSVTDEIGISLSDQSITRTKKLFFGHSASRSDTLGISKCSIYNVVKRREVGSSLQPHWQVKVPELNWELALIASSLVVQKFKKINMLIRAV